ncbi:MAG TPA: hypothetical protein DDZ80_07530 [Cyanobacteria bacterium UBA8803]|nr:hypothetical protein [Cyanobacteria bacterium UBA9273]HBL58362.1 hypothetical protein [Cyanobacteria bacterium UBA8803]
MYESPQKKTSSWTPTSIQKKSNSFSKPGSSAVQPKSDTWPNSQALLSYSTAPRDLLTANIMPSVETQEPDSSENATVQSKEVRVQQQCAACASEQQEQSGKEGKDFDEMSVAASGIQANTHEVQRQVHEQVIQRVSMENGEAIAKQLNISEEDFDHWVNEKTPVGDFDKQDFLKIISEDDLKTNLLYWKNNREKEQNFQNNKSKSQLKEAINNLQSTLKNKTIDILNSSSITKPYIDKSKTQTIELIILKNTEFIQKKLDLETSNLSENLAKQKEIEILGEIDRNRGFTVRNQKTSYVRLGTALEESVHVILHEFIHQFCHTNFAKHNELTRETATETIARAVLKQQQIEESGKDYESYIEFMAVFLNIEQAELGAFFAEDYFSGNGKFDEHIRSKFGQEAVKVFYQALPVTEVTTKLFAIRTTKGKQKKKGCNIL